MTDPLACRIRSGYEVVQIGLSARNRDSGEGPILTLDITLLWAARPKEEPRTVV